MQSLPNQILKANTICATNLDSMLVACLGLSVPSWEGFMQSPKGQNSTYWLQISLLLASVQVSLHISYDFYLPKSHSSFNGIKW